MKKTLIINFLFYISLNISAQIKVLKGGNILLCKPTNPSSTVIIGSPTPLFNPGKLQIKNFSLPSLVIDQWHSNNWEAVSISRANQVYAKHWAVDYNGNQNFFISSLGDIYNKGKNFNILDTFELKNKTEINNAISILNNLKGYQYYKSYPTYIKNESGAVDKYIPAFKNLSFGFDALETEATLPSLVQHLPDNTFAVSYTELIPILVEALKTQQNEMNDLKTRMNISTQTTDINQISQPITFEYTSPIIITYTLPQNTIESNLIIYNLQGLEIKKIPVDTHKNKIVLKSKLLKKGIYMYSFYANGQIIVTKKFIVTAK
jgi:hypothetical protein